MNGHEHALALLRSLLLSAYDPEIHASLKKLSGEQTLNVSLTVSTDYVPALYGKLLSLLESLPLAPGSSYTVTPMDYGFLTEKPKFTVDLSISWPRDIVPLMRQTYDQLLKTESH